MTEPFSQEEHVCMHPTAAQESSSRSQLLVRRTGLHLSGRADRWTVERSSWKIRQRDFNERARAPASSRRILYPSRPSSGVTYSEQQQQRQLQQQD